MTDRSQVEADARRIPLLMWLVIGAAVVVWMVHLTLGAVWGPLPCEGSRLPIHLSSAVSIVLTIAAGWLVLRWWRRDGLVTSLVGTIGIGLVALFLGSIVISEAAALLVTC